MNKNRVRFLKIKDSAATRGTATFYVNFLKTLEETKKLRAADSLQRIIYSFDLFRDPWKESHLSSTEANRHNPSNSNLGQSVLKRYLNPNGRTYFEEGGIRSTLKLLQVRREEVFNEIFMGFRLSFGSKSMPMLVEMNISPFPEKGPGVIIPF